MGVWCVSQRTRPKLIDGRRFIYVMTEFWKRLDDPVFTDFAKNKQKTIRNATPRRVRGEIRRYPTRGVRHMVERGETPKYWRAVANETQRQAGWQAHDRAFAAWREVARTMAASPAGADRAMAVGIVEFVRAMPVQRDAVVPDMRRDPAPMREHRTAPERDGRPDSPDPDIER